MSEEETRATLGRLEARLERAAAAAERLVVGAGEAATARISGVSAPGTGELELLSDALRGLRELVPADLAERVSVALRELLLAVRALIDWYVERLDLAAADVPVVQDIPII